MNRYTITQAIENVASSLAISDANDEPKIRTALNDSLDIMSKSGFAVRHDYNQELAVRKVQRLLGRRYVADAISLMNR